jgi:hypothetical protein
MKKIPFVQRAQRVRRLLETPSGIVVPHESRRPFRLWMTGSLAVVMAAMIPMRDVSNADRSNVLRLLRHSRFSVSETVQRIEAAARDRGFSVLALMPGVRPVLVLASSIGGTLVVMDEHDSQPAIPLSMMVREGQGGGADVLVSSASQANPQRMFVDLPAEVVGDIEALPGLVDHALL